MRRTGPVSQLSIELPMHSVSWPGTPFSRWNLSLWTLTAKLKSGSSHSQSHELIRVDLLWRSDAGQLYTSDTIINGAIGLIPTNRELLVQGGAIDVSSVQDETREKGLEVDTWPIQILYPQQEQYNNIFLSQFRPKVA